MGWTPGRRCPSGVSGQVSRIVARCPLRRPPVSGAVPTARTPGRSVSAQVSAWPCHRMPSDSHPPWLIGVRQCCILPVRRLRTTVRPGGRSAFAVSTHAGRVSTADAVPVRPWTHAVDRVRSTPVRARTVHRTAWQLGLPTRGVQPGRGCGPYPFGCNGPLATVALIAESAPAKGAAPARGSGHGQRAWLTAPPSRSRPPAAAKDHRAAGGHHHHARHGQPASRPGGGAAGC
jgi:hypothetical protein